MEFGSGSTGVGVDPVLIIDGDKGRICSCGMVNGFVPIMGLAITVHPGGIGFAINMPHLGSSVGKGPANQWYKLIISGRPGWCIYTIFLVTFLDGRDISFSKYPDL